MKTVRISPMFCGPTTQKREGHFQSGFRLTPRSQLLPPLSLKVHMVSMPTHTGLSTAIRARMQEVPRGAGEEDSPTFGTPLRPQPPLLKVFVLPGRRHNHYAPVTLPGLSQAEVVQQRHPGPLHLGLVLFQVKELEAIKRIRLPMQEL